MSRSLAIQQTYRHQMVRAVLGEVPAECARVASPTEVNRLAQHLADCEEACAILRAKGWGKPGVSFIDVAKAVPEKAKP